MGLALTKPEVQESRRVNREQVLNVDNLRLTIHVGAVAATVPVVNLNCLGMLVKVADQQLHSSLKVGEAIADLVVTLNRVPIGKYPEATVVRLDWHNGDGFVALAFFRKTNVVKLRKHTRIKTNPQYRPMVMCQHPFKEAGVLNFYVQDLSKGGMCLETSKRNRLLLANVPIRDMTITFPMVGQTTFTGILRGVREDAEGERLLLSVEVEQAPAIYEDLLVKYLLHFGDFAEDDFIDGIRSSGLKIRGIRSHVDFAIATERDYNEVLGLRREAYSRVGKMSAEQPLEAFADVFDLNSTILTARVRGRLIASCRVTFCESEEQRFELEDSLTLPDFIDKTKTLEISRLCITKNLLGTDMCLGMFERCTEMIGKRGVKHIITSCVDDMLKRYLSMGFKIHGEFTLTTMNNIPHYFLIMDTASIFSGKSMAAPYWSFFYRAPVAYLSRFGFIKHTRFERIRIAWLKVKTVGALFLARFTKKRKP